MTRRGTRHCWTELDLDALAGNIRRLRGALPDTTAIVFVVKSNAYGHGLAEVALRAHREGVRRFAVAHLFEAEELRRLLPRDEILVVGALQPADAAAAAALDVVPVVVSESHARRLVEACRSARVRLRCHLKIDTGMGRLGVPWEQAAAIAERLHRKPELACEGLCSHFASADESDRTFADTQARRFRSVLRDCEQRGIPAGFRHIANSGGLQCEAQWDFDGVRPGILLYGYEQRPPAAPGDTAPDEARSIPTTPCLQWRTRVLQVKPVPAGFPVSYGSTYTAPRPTCIATIDAGYADGVSRLLSNRGAVLIRGQRHPIAGRVTMNLVTVDVGPDSRVEDGDRVTLLGRDGDAAIWADEIAQWAQTISYEVLTSIRTADRRVL